MPVEVIMPHMGESVAEGKILRWLKRAGERVREDEPLVEIETDKINVEVPAPASGVLSEVRAQEGETVAVEQVIAVIAEAGEAPAPVPSAQEQTREPEGRKGAPSARTEAAAARPAARTPAKATAGAGAAVAPILPAPPSATHKAGRAEKAPGTPAAEASSAPPLVVPEEPIAAPTEGPVEPGRLAVLASPAVRRLARQLGVDLAQVRGSGRMGRITREDVESFAEAAKKRAAEEEARAAAAPPAGEGLQAGASRPPRVKPGADEELVPLSKMRRAIAEHMARSKREAPHVTTVAEVDMTEAARFREAQRAAFDAKGVKLTYTACILHAVARALHEHPELNASWTDDGILIKYRIHIGLAVAVEEGLVVPVIRDADRLSLLDLARAVQTLAEKTRQGKIAAADLAGGTFTVTNPGVFGAVLSTPILHRPQAAILAIGRIADVPAVVDGGIAIRKRMFLSLSYDHRVVDGASAVRFLQRVREILEKADFPAGAP